MGVDLDGKIELSTVVCHHAIRLDIAPNHRISILTLPSQPGSAACAIRVKTMTTTTRPRESTSARVTSRLIR